MYLATVVCENLNSEFQQFPVDARRAQRGFGEMHSPCPKGVDQSSNVHHRLIRYGPDGLRSRCKSACESYIGIVHDHHQTERYRRPRTRG